MNQQENMNQITPASVAIAGAWGYIGRKFLDASVALGLRPYVHDPGEIPADVNIDRITRIADAEPFYRLPAELFHLALHPEHRRPGTDILLERGRQEPLLILCEKPMATPECPEECQRMVDATGNLTAAVLYDFPELFDSMTRRIEEYLAGFNDVRITEFHVTRSKDREDRANPRNYKRMVPIQYQESVHCLAFVLNLLGRLRGDLSAVFDQGITVRAEAEPYNAPNPELYPFVVDGRCRYTLALGELAVQGETNFKAGADFTKRRIISGTADGQPFRIDAEYLEGQKRLVINGVDQGCDPRADSYAQVLLTANRWQKEIGAHRLADDVFPNARFAQVTYQLSSVLWRSSTDRRPIRLRSMRELAEFDSRFRDELPRLPRY